MALAVEAPAREELALFDNDDRIVGAIWYAADGVTPVPVTRAVFTLQFDLAPIDDTVDPPLPVPDPERHVIDSAAPDPEAGTIDGPSLAQGRVIVTVPHTIWAGYATRTGGHDLIAVDGNGLQRCLVRGSFVVETGVSR